MKRTLITVLAIALCIGQGFAADLGPRVSIGTGILHGTARDEHGALAFKGIPYAAPPVGDLRWASPRPPEAWSGERDATRFGSRCLSALTGDAAPGPARGEDCLTANVWTAARRADEKRPVMVWIYGGGFQFGSSAEPRLDGARLARKGVVLVSMNYRTGVLGFLAHPDLDREGPSGNYGLQDQIAALRWVKSNIGRFGGDPDNVTVFGESAGAHAIGILMASPLAEGLFHKAIGASGAFWDSEHGSLPTKEEARERGVRFARQMSSATPAEMRRVPAERLNSAAGWDFTKDPGTTAFSPSVDGHVVPETPAAAYLRGAQMRVPLLAGWNQVEEWPFRARALPHGSAQNFRAAAAKVFGEGKLPDFLALYPAGSDLEAKGSAEALIGDLVISQQTWEWADLHSRSPDVPVYAYKFTYTSPYVPIAGHAVDVAFQFGTLTPQVSVGGGAPPAENDRAFSDRVMSYWTNFAARGDPNGPDLAHWPRYAERKQVQELGKSIGPMRNDQEARFRFIAGHRTEGRLPDRWRDGVR